MINTSNYWFSTTYEGDTNGAWLVSMGYGSVFIASKATVYYVWPVRSDN